MRNNNTAAVKKIARHTLSADKRRNFFVTAAVTLTAFMIASVFSIGMSYYESINMREKRMQGSVSHMAFASPTDEQLAKTYKLDYIKAVGVGTVVAQTTDVPKLGELDFAYVDETQWKEMFCPAFTDIIGYYPEQENEIMLSRYILDTMGIDTPEIGMEIPLSYIIGGKDETGTTTFILSCIYTEYSHSRTDGYTAIYSSYGFADKNGKITNQNSTVNIIFKDSNHISESIQRLKTDLDFSENQPYIQSPVYDNYGNTTTYAALALIVTFIVFTGYLLIYNVMYISVAKEVRFYGMLKTLGTTPRQIRHIVIRQILPLCVIALPVGCAASAAVSFSVIPAILRNSGIDTGAVISFSPFIYFGAVLFALLTALIGAITPAQKAANISPIEALKYTGKPAGKQTVQSSIYGKSYKMALRNIFRDRKRATIVMLSLFLSITVFTSVMTILGSINIDNYLIAEYQYDYSFSANQTSSYYLPNETVDNIMKVTGVKETGTTTIASAELLYSEQLNSYVDSLLHTENLTKSNIIQNNTFMWEHGIKGIDTLAIREINQTLSVPIDMEAFEHGEIAVINVMSEELADSFDGVSAIDIISSKDGSTLHLPIGGVVSQKVTGSSVFSYSDMEIIVANSFLRQHFPEAKMLAVDMNVDMGYEKSVHDALSNIIDPNEVSIISRYEARETMQDTKIIMLVLGGGVSFILGLIGIFNFINVMSVGIMVRKREFAALESIGMSKNQMRTMLRSEGIGYATLTIVLSMTLGNIVACALFLLFRSVASYAVFTYPFIPVLSFCVAISFICLVTPELAYRGISRISLTERLRETE